MELLQALRSKNPLVYNITNEVVTNFVANGLLAIGASPVMANDPKEAREMTTHASALVLNIGTITQAQKDAMFIAGKEANERNIPVILDPVGVGVTSFRTKIIEKLLEQIDVTAIRGNIGEIVTLGDQVGQVRGVDSLATQIDLATAKKVAKTFDTIVLATGETDVITNGNEVITCKNGHAMLPSITGSGCLLSSVLGAFLASGEDPLEAAAYTVCSYGIAGEQAAKKSAGPGTFKTNLLDMLYQIEDSLVEENMQITTTSED